MCFSLNNFFTVGTWKVSGVNFGHLLAACLNNPISNIHHIDFMVLSFNKQCPINYIYCAPVWTIPVFLEVPIRVTNKMTGCITMTYVHAHYDGQPLWNFILWYSIGEPTASLLVCTRNFNKHGIYVYQKPAFVSIRIYLI